MQFGVANYLRSLVDGVADGWNRFWFMPSDPYPLGLIRLLTGCLATFLHLTLLPDAGRLFGAGGWISHEAVDRLTVRGGSVSYLDLFSSPGELMAMQVVGLAVLVLFALGFRSRLTSVLALAVVLADVHRGPMLTSQFEPVLTMVMCYLCLGPSGASWSLDHALARRRATTALARAAVENSVPSWTATVSIRLMQVHLAMLLATMGGAKLFGATWWVGSAVWWLASRPESRLVDLTGLPEYLINFWTHAIVAVEISFPIFVWIPLLRPLMLALAALVWISLALLTGQITFAAIMLVASLSYCSPAWLRGCCQKSDRPAALAA
ncbi:MAG TPA: hypothetical protein VHY91_05655 [Pirellulales bacterium]|jgi:hypothetical protein|nr:hypothetical protein [Pirellulales bacterium]